MLELSITFFTVFHVTEQVMVPWYGIFWAISTSELVCKKRWLPSQKNIVMKIKDMNHNGIIWKIENDDAKEEQLEKKWNSSSQKGCQNPKNIHTSWQALLYPLKGA